MDYLKDDIGVILLTQLTLGTFAIHNLQVCIKFNPNGSDVFFFCLRPGGVGVGSFMSYPFMITINGIQPFQS